MAEGSTTSEIVTVTTAEEKRHSSRSGRAGGRGRGRGGGRGRGRGAGRSRGRGGRGRSNHTKGESESRDSPIFIENDSNSEVSGQNEGGDPKGIPNCDDRFIADRNSPPPASNGQPGRDQSPSRGKGRGRNNRGRGRGTRSGRGRSSNGRGRGRGRSNEEQDENKKGNENGKNAISDTSDEKISANDNSSSLPNNVIEENVTEEAGEITIQESQPTLSLPSVPSNFANRKNSKIPMILTRSNLEESQARPLPKQTGKKKEKLGRKEDTKEASTASQSTKPIKPEKKKKNKKKKKTVINENNVNEEDIPVEPVVEEVSATDAIKALPAQEVSITSADLVKVAKKDSSNSLNKLGDEGLPGSDKISTKPGRSGKSRKKKGLSGDEAADRKAARHFNREVRNCVERSDPDAMRALLRDKRNHNFALESTVLETVLKAYIMAAMFDDALYCLRNCTLPGTLATAQTERILLCLPQNLRNSSAFTAADMINALCISTDFDMPTKRTYFLRIVRGIALEFLEEAMSARDRICSAPCERLVRSAQCVVDARLKRGKKATEIYVNPGNQLGVFVPDTMENRGIQAGDAVSILPYAGPYPMSAESLDRNMIEATVTNTNPMVLRLQDKTNANLYAMLTDPVEGNVYRIDKLANRMGFNRQLASAVSFVSPITDESKNGRDARRPSPELIKAVTAMDENIDLVMKAGFKTGSNGELTSTAALCSQPVPWNVGDDSPDSDFDSIRDASRLALEKYGALEGLNASQRLAVEGAATNRLTLVQGPPGTGKTQVAIRILRHWAKLAASQSTGGNNPYPILATSDSNIAVDNLVEGCASAGLRVVRLGRPEAIRPELLRFCIDRPTSGNGKSNNNSQYGSVSAFKEKIKLIRNAQVVCCTCIGSGGDILENMMFERVLVDEATQATEPAVLVPLARGCRQLVLVGDHCQLPPTVLSTRAEEEGLGVPLFSRMVACGVPPFMLDTQYRMHPGIAMFPSDLFYGGKLLNGVSAPERRPLAGFPWPREEFPIAYVPVQGNEVDDGVSKLNEAEAAAAYDAVEHLLKGGQCRISDIAVVTPYAAQARLIRRMLRQLTQGFDGYVEVSSVDGFQGREKEAVVFSAVRSNSYGSVGFVKDWRRVNVSFTRARRALIVIGNDQCLRRGDPDTWMPWLAWADAHGINMDKPGIPRGRYEPEQLRRVRGGTTAAEMLKDVLERQQAQLKTAEKQLETAARNAAGHIIGNTPEGGLLNNGGDETIGNGGVDSKDSLQQALANLETDNWDDDSDDEEDYQASSQPTLSAVSSLNDLAARGSDQETDSNGPLDAWDL